MMTMSEHRQIEAFRAVMQTGTMTEAGRVLRSSQPSVSRLITQLERKLGVALFLRRQGRVVPTDAAHRLYEVVEKSFIGLAAILQHAADIREFREAQVIVAAMPALSLDIVPLAVARYLGDWPAARIAVHARSSRQVVNMVLAREADIGIATPPFDSPGVRCDIQVEVPYVCLLHPAHPLAARAVIAPADLAGEPLIGLTNSITRLHLEEAFRSAGQSYRPRVETPLSVVAARQAELGSGIAIVDPYAANYCAGRALVVRAFRPAVPFVFGVIRPDGAQENAAAAAFREILLEVLRSAGMPDFAPVSFR
jgi:DNA-binding transcriptional LysR family regulator